MTEKKKDVQVEKRGEQPVELTRDQPVFTPATDIYEKPDAIMLMCDMPGVDDKNIDITLEDDVLTITGFPADAGVENHELLYRGYKTGAFRRSFTLTADVDRDKIQAKLRQGVLHLVLPKAEKAQPRKIAVEVTG